ncbi:MAG: tyrosine-type recombinase/integrase, partial [Variovorax sp.]
EHLVNDGGKQVLTFRQSKTKAQVKIEVTPDLHELFEAIRLERKGKGVESDYLVPREDGGQYTYSGLTSMASRFISDAGVTDFGIYDAKSKGATDMFTSGTPIEDISALCAHDSITTTERYVRRHLTKTVQPNSRDLNLPAEPRKTKYGARKKKVEIEPAISI